MSPRSRTTTRLTVALAGALTVGLGPVVLTPTATAVPAVAASPRTSAVTVKVPSGLGAAPFNVTRKLTIPAGWSISVWARPVGARLLAFAPDGHLLVSQPGSGTVTMLTPRSGAAPSSKVILRGLRKPHGLAFDGNTLYVAETNRVSAYHYHSGSGALTGRSTLVSGLPDSTNPELHGQYGHELKSVAVGTDHLVYVSIGSTGNVSPEDRSASPQRASILQVNPWTGRSAVFARGVRNGTGLAVASNNAVWTAVNNRDRTAYPYAKDYNGNGTNDQGKVLQDYVDEHPLEPLAHLTKGRDLGWPYCNPDPDVTPGSPTTKLTYRSRPFIRDIETNADGSKLDCSRLAPVEQGLGAHSAPLGLSFTRSSIPSYGGGALVGVHGSWNRTPPRAPEIAFFPWSGSGLGNQQTLVTGWQSSNGARWGRAVMAVQGPDGAVYISDDGSGTVYRLQPKR